MIKPKQTLASDSPAEDYDVQQVKKALNRLGYYMPYEKTGITGIPDKDLFDAIRRFQADKGLRATGVMRPDDETVKALSAEETKKKTGKYIWRDDRVRGAHAKLGVQVRDYTDSPTLDQPTPHRRKSLHPGIKRFISLRYARLQNTFLLRA